ncbi:MAG: phosphopantetheine-binding protein [Gemmatimonadota bacterium]|nr:phosphopantetheine-binding protein [Gemmatimonadota bacterium]
MNVRTQVERYIAELTNTQDIDPSVNLFESGHLTSLDALELLSFIETTFEISILGDDISVENLGSIDSIVRYVEGAKQLA